MVRDSSVFLPLKKTCVTGCQDPHMEFPGGTGLNEQELIRNLSDDPWSENIQNRRNFRKTLKETDPYRRRQSYQWYKTPEQIEDEKRMLKKKKEIRERDLFTRNILLDKDLMNDVTTPYLKPKNLRKDDSNLNSKKPSSSKNSDYQNLKQVREEHFPNFSSKRSSKADVNPYIFQKMFAKNKEEEMQAQRNFRSYNKFHRVPRPKVETKIG